MTTHERSPSGLLRARGLGLRFAGEPGPCNAITDVHGVEVGHRTLIRGDGPLVVGHGPVRTGVTAIHPRGRARGGAPVFAGVHSLNGNGEMTGFVWIEECGRTETPIVLTNTHSVGLARDAVVQWMVQRHPSTMPQWCLPVAAETFDGTLNDINGFHVTQHDVWAALDDARGGAIDEGSVGGGTGMVCYEFKGGIGTSSRKVTIDDVGTGAGTGYAGIVGALVQANFGRRSQLRFAGASWEQFIAAHAARRADGRNEAAHGQPHDDHSEHRERGSIIVVLATDLPLMPHQLKRLARRAALGIGRSGAIAGHGSGDIFLAFSTANDGFFSRSLQPRPCLALPDDALSPVFNAVIEAVNEAVWNALVVNRDMTGRDGTTIHALPHDVVRAFVAAQVSPMST